MDTTIEQLKTSNTAGQQAWRRWFIPLAVIVLFAAGVLQFALIEWNHLPAEQRVNNGQKPTFFALYILPSFNFSEDFYLYHIRAKRIANRGWSDSLLYSRPEESSNFAAPVQVGLSKLAIMTDGKPVAYSLYMFALLATAWIALYAAARCWLADNVRTASILLAVLITVLFEATPYLISNPEFPTYGQWPMFRGLRMSTMSWTSPLLVAVMLCITSLAIDRSRWWARIVLLLGMLLLLAGADNWAFGIAWFASGLMLAWIAIKTVVGRLRSGNWPTASRATACSLLIVVGGVFLLHRLVNGSMDGDMLARAGFGSEWGQSVRPAAKVLKVRDWFVNQGLLPVAVSLIGSWLLIRPTSGGRLPLKLSRRANDAYAVQIRLLALLPAVAMLVMYQVLKARGMEPFLRFQLFWRANYCWLFVFALAMLEWWREALAAWSASRTSKRTTPAASKFESGSNHWHALRPRGWTAAMAVGIALLFAYHNYRLHWFVSNIAARDFFLTADAEKLRPWLEEYERTHGDFKLATASIELNYLAAYWTNADLLLPSGFPYHNAADNLEIRERTLQLLRLYRTTPNSWNKFVCAKAGRFQEAWLSSRIDASRKGYLYHLYHRMVSFDTTTAPRWKSQEQKSISRSLAKRVTGIADAKQKAANSTGAPSVDVILIDEVSRALGRPNLTNYTREFCSGNIEAWVRRDSPSVQTASTQHTTTK